MLLSQIQWFAADKVLTPGACLVAKAGFGGLFKRLLQFDPKQLSQLKGVWNEQVVVLVGEQSGLPWCPQIVYYGNHPDSPNLFTPTNLDCSISFEVLQQAILSRFGAGNYLFDPQLALLLPLTDVKSVDRAFVELCMKGLAGETQ